MTTVTETTIINRNTTLQTNYKFALLNLPNVTYFCKTANLPGVSVGEIGIRNPNATIYVPGNPMKFDDTLNISFLVDEDYQNWKELFSYFVRIGMPYGTVQGRSSSLGQPPVEQDFTIGTLTITSNAKKPLFGIKFNRLFPVSMSGLDFTTEGDGNPITCSAVFRYTTYEIIP